MKVPDQPGLTSLWRIFAKTIAEHPISLFAVICVMATGAFLGYVTLQLLGVLSSPEWCSKALQAERITPGNTFVGLTACVDLLKLQVQAQATALLISIGGYNLVLVVLIVVVVAGARASGKADQSGFAFNVGRDDKPLPEPEVTTTTTTKVAPAKPAAAPPAPPAPNAVPPEGDEE